MTKAGTVGERDLIASQASSCSVVEMGAREGVACSGSCLAWCSASPLPCLGIYSFTYYPAHLPAFRYAVGSSR